MRYKNLFFEEIPLTVLHIFKRRKKRDLKESVK